jgi:predicted nucleic-acid-binding protein
MIGLDTNVVLRWLINDPRLGDDAAGQADSAAAVLGRTRETVFVNRIVLAEMAWVLRRKLGLAKADVADFVGGLIATVDVELEDPPVVRDALESFRRGPGDFADHLIGVVNASRGCRTTYTFDRAASNTAHFSSFPAASG